MSRAGWWDSIRTGGKKGFDAGWKQLDRLGAPVNKLTNKLGSEAFWPTTLDLESDKAARILKSFCKDGFYAEEERRPQDGPTMKQKVIKKIPSEVIKNAKGLAIFTTMRTGLWMSGAGGSGVLIGRLPDGSWSPPSGIMLHTAGLGFLVGVDIYDCVVVINTEAALQAFTKIRCTLGSEISVAAGPVGAGGIVDTEIHKRHAPILTYMKSRGFYAGVQIDGTVIIERGDENERFYGYKYPVKDILAGKVRHPPYELRRLFETLKAAQGDTTFDPSAIPEGPPPGDYTVDDGHMFGVPDKEDPDPYGVLALEKEGLGLKEAGTLKRASWEQFAFNPAPTSPIHQLYRSSSQDLSKQGSRPSSWRASVLSNEPKTPSSLRNSIDRSATTRPRGYTDTSTQTDLAQEPTSTTGSSFTSRRSTSRESAIIMPGVPEHEVLDTSPPREEDKHTGRSNGYNTPPHTPPINSGVHEEQEDHAADDVEEEEAHIEEPVVHSVQTMQPASPMKIMSARLVTVPKRGPPPVLPPRNPHRGGPVIIDASPKTARAEEGDSAGPATVDGAEGTEQQRSEAHASDVLDVSHGMEDVRLGDADDEKVEVDRESAVVQSKDDLVKRKEQEEKAAEEHHVMPGGFE
ncbi:hypothetical protein LTR62_003106 [Meristemomyces frigidus]|uniref:Ysc84 actin-binding domain-containing protein n=1 Tax=Meristemomyces frigidus TaxID=1508187 RepID=A0AAN7YPZ3_9PEZI|nr:hypothetical protein LTR62_003106 [Meristemomyces frigidus]